MARGHRAWIGLPTGGTLLSREALRRRVKQFGLISSWWILGLAGIGSVYSLSFLLTAWLTSRFHWVLGMYLRDMTTLGMTLLLLVILGTAVHRLVRPRQRLLWQSLIEALRNMSKGNFDVRLNVDMIRGEPGGQEHPIRLLVHSINNMAQELAELEQMRQEFISNVSHEIQSPLTSIQGFTAAIRQGNLSTEQQEHYLNIIEAESKRLSRLSDNLLKLTSLESGYHPYHAEPYRLDRQIRDIVLACEPTWSDKHIQVQVQAPSVEICADKDLLSQVWVNILSNAIKFTPEQGFIDISVHVSAEGVVVSITDTGMGMTEEEQERVFERFYKANTSRVTSGAGLGLSIVKKIVDLHHGTVQVVSAVNGGSTFTVSLPRAQTPLLS